MHYIAAVMLHHVLTCFRVDSLYDTSWKHPIKPAYIVECRLYAQSLVSLHQCTKLG